MEDKNQIETRLKITVFIMCISAFMLRPILGHDVIAVSIITVIALIAIHKFEAAKHLKMLLILNFMISSIYALGLYTNSVIKFPDTLHYLEMMNKLNVSGFLSFKKVVSLTETLHVGGYYYNYIVYKIFGTTLALYMANILLRILSLIFFHYSISMRFDKRMAGFVALLLSLSNYLVIFTSDILKDSLILFLSILSLFIYEKYLCEKKTILLLSLLLVIIALTTTRIYAGLGFALGYMCDYIVSIRSCKERIKLISFIAILFVFALRWDIFFTYFKLSKDFIEGTTLSIENVTITLRSTVAFFFSPVFWNMNNQFTVYTPILWDSIFLLVFSPALLLFLTKYVQSKELRQKTYIYIIPIVIHIVTLSHEYKTAAIRQRIAVYPFIILLYALGLIKKESSPQNHFLYLSDF